MAKNNPANSAPIGSPKPSSDTEIPSKPCGNISKLVPIFLPTTSKATAPAIPANIPDIVIAVMIFAFVFIPAYFEPATENPEALS